MDHPDVNDKLDRIGRKVDQIHFAMFGTEGQGGVMREVSDLRKSHDEMRAFKFKVIGGATIASIVAGVVTKFVGGK